MKRNPPKIYEYYGYPVYHRFAKRDGLRFVVFSIRPEANGILLERDMRIPVSLQGAADDLILQELVPKYLARVLGRQKNGLPPAEKAELFQTLPFAVIWLADRDGMIQDHGWAIETVQEYDRAADWVITHFGSLPLEMLTPKTTGARRVNLSDRANRSIIRMMREITQYEMQEKNLTENTWLNYNPKSAKTKPSSKSLAKQMIWPSMLTNVSVHNLCCLCKKMWRERKEPLSLAAWIYFTTMLSAEEICALRKADLTQSRFYRNCWTLMIRQEQVKSGTVYHSRPFTDPNRIRQLPVSYQLGRALKELTEQKAFQSLPDSAPMFGAPKNRLRCMRPDQFLQWIASEFKMNNQRIIKNTVERNLKLTGMTEDMLRYLSGKSVTTTADRHYCDFGLDVVLDHLASYQNRWIENLDMVIEHSSSFEKSGIRQFPARGMPGNTMDIQAVIRPSGSDLSEPAQIHLLIGAKRGFDVTATIEKITSNETQKEVERLDDPVILAQQEIQPDAAEKVGFGHRGPIQPLDGRNESGLS